MALRNVTISKAVRSVLLARTSLVHIRDSHRSVLAGEEARHPGVSHMRILGFVQRYDIRCSKARSTPHLDLI
eukprot:COSAG02_NODE_5064_length_4677_cov_1.407820_6_plen_72_part_00